MSRKEKFFWWKIIITVISFIAVILSKSTIDWSNLSNNYIDLSLCKEIVYDLSVGIFSAMILVWFIDEINEHIQDNTNKKTETEKIKRANRILQQYIERYQLFFYCVTTPIEKRDFENIKISSNFSLKDMRELYLTSMLISEGVFDSSIECFVKAETQLREEIELTLRDIEFCYFPQIRECLLEFVEVSLKYNQKEAWLSAKTTTAANTTLADHVKDLLENTADKWYEEINSGKDEHPHNLVHTYIALYEMLKAEHNVIEKYKEEIEKLQ